MGYLLPASPATRSLPPPCAGAHCTAPRRMGSKNWSHVNLLIFLPQPPITLIYHVAAQVLWGCQNHKDGKGERGLSLPAGASNLHQIWSNVDPHPTLQACGLEMCISWLEQWWNKAAWQHRSHSEQQSQAMELTRGANMELTVGPVAISISPVASCCRHALLTQVMCFLTWVIACMASAQNKLRHVGQSLVFLSVASLPTSRGQTRQEMSQCPVSPPKCFLFGPVHL